MAYVRLLGYTCIRVTLQRYSPIDRQSEITQTQSSTGRVAAQQLPLYFFCVFIRHKHLKQKRTTAF